MRVKVKITGEGGYRHTMVTTLEEMRGGAYSDERLEEIRATVARGGTYRHQGENGVAARFAYRRA